MQVFQRSKVYNTENVGSVQYINIYVFIYIYVQSTVYVYMYNIYDMAIILRVCHMIT